MNKGIEFYLPGSRVRLPNEGTSSNPSTTLKKERKERLRKELFAI